MKHEELLEANCAISRAGAMLGERWMFAILRASFLRARTFEDFQRTTGIARNILTERLGRLVDFGILQRVPYDESERRVRYEYRLTDAGLELYPIVVAAMDWGNRHTGLPDGPPIELVHKGCGAKAMPRLTCPECGEVVGARDMQPVPGPGAIVPTVP